MSTFIVAGGATAGGGLCGYIAFLVFKWEWREPGKGSHRRWP